MVYPKLIIPKMNDIEKLYIYRSINSNDINTISKIANLEPIIVIDQNIAQTVSVNGEQCYIVYDEYINNVTGITYNGPVINTVSNIEYETDINLIMLTPYTFVNELVLSPLEITNKEGTMYYYSVIGVNESNSTMSHLSKVAGALCPRIEQQDSSIQVWSCDDYNNNENDEWVLVNTLEYNETDDKIRIGNITRPYNIDQLGLPVVETVPKIQNVNASLNSLISNTFMVLEVQNPWQNNNKEFNYRKLKSYKMRNVYESLYGEFSVPTYQSELPVSIEKMVIMYKENPSDRNAVIRYDDDAHKIEIIRRDGIFYDKSVHKTLGYNQWNIPLESNSLAVYSEASIQETINIQISASAGNLYVFDIYLIDVYQNVSENTHYIIET